MANSNKKGAKKAQSLSEIVKNATNKSQGTTVIPHDGRHIVYLKKCTFVTSKKDGMPMATPLIRLWLGLVGSNDAFNAVKFLNADFESGGQTFESSNMFLLYFIGSILSPEWAEKHSIKFTIQVANAAKVVELIEAARSDRGTRSFVVETKSETDEVTGFTNTRITRIEARIPKPESKAEPKGKPKAGSSKPWNKGKTPSKGKSTTKSQDSDYIGSDDAPF